MKVALSPQDVDSGAAGAVLRMAILQSQVVVGETMSLYRPAVAVTEIAVRYGALGRTGTAVPRPKRPGSSTPFIYAVKRH